MRNSRSPREVLVDLEDALHLMEEGSHSGLDDNTANFLRTVLRRRIAEAECAITRESGNVAVADDEVPE